MILKTCALKMAQAKARIWPQAKARILTGVCVPTLLNSGALAWRCDGEMVNSNSSIHVGLSDCSQADRRGFRNKPVIFGAKQSPVDLSSEIEPGRTKQ